VYLFISAIRDSGNRIFNPETEIFYPEFRCAGLTGYFKNHPDSGQDFSGISYIGSRIPDFEIYMCTLIARWISTGICMDRIS
jgi:hypothetical protein